VSVKNLYIYTFYENGIFDKKILEDVKITRGEGKIVTKRDSEYKLSHGNYKYKDNLNKVIRVSTITSEYISLEDLEITQQLKEILIQPFIDELQEKKEIIQKRIEQLEKFKDE
jgi:hypothetical protein